MDDEGHARITYFGLATVAQDFDSMRSAEEDHGHTARWTAPEILSEMGTYSKEADVFSFAMVMVEVRWKSVTPEDLLLIAIRCRCRYLPVRFRSAIVYPQQRCWP